MLKKPQDEWGVIINKQAELNQRREQEEKIRQQKEKERYRSELEQQALFNQKRKEEEQRLREAESLTIKLQAKAFQSEEERRKYQESQLHKSLADEYLTQASSLKTRQQVELQSKLKEEQDLIRFNQALLEEDRRRKLQQREKLFQDDQEMLQGKSISQRRRQQEAKNQMLQDLDLLRMKKEAEEKKEKDYRDYFERVSDQQAKKQQLYSQKVAVINAEKDFHINSWVNKSVDDYQRSVQEKMEKDRKARQAHLENVNQTLKHQLDEKNKNEMLRSEEKKRLADELQRKIDENKRIEEEKLRNRRQQQAEYFTHLSYQANEASDMRTSVFKLSETEKKMNKQYSVDVGIGKNNLSLGAQEILKPNFRASSIFASPIDPIVKTKNSVSSSTISRPFESVLSPALGYKN
jgi:hypothetical protein